MIRLVSELCSYLRFDLLPVMMMIIISSIPIVILLGLIIIVLVVILILICLYFITLSGLLFVDETIYLRLGLLDLSLAVHGRAPRLESIETSVIFHILLIASSGLIQRIVVLVG